jgi:hypothetical protein
MVTRHDRMMERFEVVVHDPRSKIHDDVVCVLGPTVRSLRIDFRHALHTSYVRTWYAYITFEYYLTNFSLKTLDDSGDSTKHHPSRHHPSPITYESFIHRLQLRQNQTIRLLLHSITNPSHFGG